MDKKKQPKTPEEEKKQVRKWQLNSNRTRRKRYRNEPAYRKEVRERARQAARDNKGIVGGTRVAAVREGIERADEEAVNRMMLGDKLADQQEAQTLSPKELAPLIGLACYASLSRWQAQGIFPSPNKMAIIRKVQGYVFLLEDAKRLLKIMEEHYSRKNYFGAADKETTKQLYRAIGEVPPKMT